MVVVLQTPTSSREALLFHTLNADDFNPGIPEQSQAFALHIVWRLSDALRVISS